MEHNWCIHNYMGKSDEIELYKDLIYKILVKLTKKIDKKVDVIMAHIPSIIKDGHYPVLVEQNPSITYIYLYFIDVGKDYTLNNNFHFGKKPDHALTFSQYRQKSSLYNKINMMKKEIELNARFGVINYDPEKNVFPSADIIVNPLISDQNIKFEDYITNLFVGVQSDLISKILNIEDLYTVLISLESIIQEVSKTNPAERDKIWTAYEKVDSIIDENVKNLVIIYNNLIGHP